jgi:hypothetical protein
VKEKVKPAKILCSLNADNEEETLSCVSVYDWKDKSPEGHKEVLNLSHILVHPTAVFYVNICNIRQLIVGNKQITLHDIASNSGICVGSVVTIIHEH